MILWTIKKTGVMVGRETESGLIIFEVAYNQESEFWEIRKFYPASPSEIIAMSLEKMKCPEIAELFYGSHTLTKSELKSIVEFALTQYREDIKDGMLYEPIVEIDKLIDEFNKL